MRTSSLAFSFLALSIACSTLSACGDLPRPFAGNPGRAAMALAVPPPPRLIIPAPTAALLPEQDSTAWAKDLANALVTAEIPAFQEPARGGEWQLRLSATLDSGMVATKYTYLDPKGRVRGEISGMPVAASAWASGDAGVLQRNADLAAPKIVELLKSVDAAVKQSDPNSLYNRPARVYFSGVTGAPGDGDVSLARGMRLRLPETGDQLVERAAGADFLLRGTVKMTDEPGGVQQVEIHWLVNDAGGAPAGDVAQGHDVAKGTLDHYWGDIASAVTDEAASGVHEVITNYTGRKKDLRKAHAG